MTNDKLTETKEDNVVLVKTKVEGKNDLKRGKHFNLKFI